MTFRPVASGSANRGPLGFRPFAKLAASRGPHGEVVVTKMYTNFRYKLTMRTNGAIQVQLGDWLSKYSAAIYNDFAHIHEFGRMDASGNLRRVQNVNRIFTGETIYHIPTYRKAHRLYADNVDCTASPLSEEERVHAIVEMLKADYDLQGERLDVLECGANIVFNLNRLVLI